jgi:heme/copper-type cytochrome/quinol oxidase subunit 2/uncharacterized membrane protein
MLEIWLKAAHIAFLALWTAGLVALPALIGPRIEPEPDEHARRLRFTRLAYELVVSPAAVFTVATGTALVFVASWETPWLAAKLAAVGGMGLLHMLIGRGLARRSRRLEPGPAGRAAMALGAVLLISAVLGFVLGKPALPAEDFLPAFLLEGRPRGFPGELFSGLGERPAAAGALLAVPMRRRGAAAARAGPPARRAPGAPLARGASVALAAALPSGCAGPLSTLDPAGPAAQDVATLWWIMLAGATLILLGVCALALAPFLRAGRADAAASRAPSDRVWLWGGGLAFPIATLFALMLYAFVLEPIDDAARTGAEPLRVQALARQWDWRFVHPDAPGGPLATDGRLHIPAGRPVTVAITSADVIHSFWVPRLAGKRDAIPGRVNTITILAETPGVYGAICAEFCGYGHTGMVFEVVAHEATAYRGALARLAAETDATTREARR